VVYAGGTVRGVGRGAEEKADQGTAEAGGEAGDDAQAVSPGVFDPGDHQRTRSAGLEKSG